MTHSDKLLVITDAQKKQAKLVIQRYKRAKKGGGMKKKPKERKRKGLKNLFRHAPPKPEERLEDSDDDIILK